MPMSYTASSSVATADAPDFHTDGTSPDAGIFAGVDNAGRSVVDLLTLLFTITGDPQGRADLAKKSKPDAAQIQTMAAKAERILDERVQMSPEAKAVVDAHFSGSGEARRGALCVVLYTMLPVDDVTVGVYQWVNAWLNSSSRGSNEVAEHIGPFFVAYHEAVLKLPVKTSKASRAVRVGDFPKLNAAHQGYRVVFAPGRPVNFWGVASFTEDDSVMSGEDFLGPSNEMAIVFTCPAMRGHDVSLLSAMPDEKEFQPTTPSHFRVLSSCLVLGKLVVTLEQVVPAPASTTDVAPAAGSSLPATTEAVLAATLAELLPAGRNVTLPDGSTFGKRQACLRAIELDSRCASAYASLASTMSKTEAIEFPNGSTFTAKHLYIEAIAFDSDCVSAYVNLAASLWPGSNSVRLNNGLPMNARELCLKAIAIDSRCALAYSTLARALMDGTEKVKLPDGEKVDRLQLCLKAIALDRRSAHAYETLGRCLLADDETVTLPSGQVVDGKLLRRWAAMVSGGPPRA